jgi:hypothetical protein
LQMSMDAHTSTDSQWSGLQYLCNYFPCVFFF